MNVTRKYLLACMVLFYIAAPVLCAEEVPSEPHLIFEKSVVEKPYRGGRVYTKPHTVKRGEYLWRILRKHYNMSNRKIAFYSKIAAVINPDIKDLNQLYPEQKILIPYKYIRRMKAALAGDDETRRLSASGTEITLSRGEHLGSILRKEYALPDSVIFSRITYRLIEEANPQVTDVHVLEVGQTLKIPREVFLMRESIRQGILSEDAVAATAIPRPEPAEPAAANSDSAQESVTADETDLSRRAPEIGEVPLSPEETKIKNMLSAVARSFDAKDNSTGRDIFPIAGGGAVTLDYSKFPVYEFPWGKKVLFDYGGRMPRGMKDILTAEWDNAEIVSVQEKDDIESILGKVLDGCGFFKVEKDGEYIVNRDNIQVSVSGKWIVFKDRMMKNVFVVNLVDDGQEALNPEMHAYLEEMGLKFVDIKTGSAGRKRPDKKDAAGSGRAGQRIVVSEPAVLTDLILELTGQAFSRDYSTKIFQNMYSGFSLEVVADRMFKKGDVVCLIDFQGLPSRIAQIIREQGFELLQIDVEKQGLETVAGRLLDFTGAAYRPPPAKFGYEPGGQSNIRLSVPGYLIQTESGDTLLTRIDLDKNIIIYLSEKNINIIKY